MNVKSLITDGVVVEGTEYKVAYELDDQYVVVWINDIDLYTINVEDFTTV